MSRWIIAIGILFGMVLVFLSFYTSTKLPVELPGENEILFGAVGIDTSGTKASQTCNLTSTNSVTITGSDTLLTVIVAVSSNITPSTVTWGGTSLTKASGSANTVNVSLWYAATGSGGTQTVTVTLPGSGVCSFSWLSLTGVDQAAPLDAAVGSLSGFGTNPSNNIVTVADNALVVDIFGFIGRKQQTVPGTQTAFASTTVGTQGYSGTYKGPITPAGSTAMSRTATSVNWAQAIASFCPSGGCSGGGGGTSSAVDSTVFFTED